jgi:phosphatidate cytidylyltransferase
MLRLRVITAVVLLLALLGAFAIGHQAVAAVLAALIGGAVYEWLRLSGVGAHGAVGSGVIVAFVLAFLEWRSLGVSGAALDFLLTATILAWLVILGWLLRAAQVEPAPNPGVGAKIGFGVLLLAGAWWAVLALYRVSSLFLFSALAVVWVADIAAYFAGRAFGRRKLAVRISPGKTWAGVVGAVVAVLAVAVLAWLVWPQGEIFSNLLLARAPLLALPLLAVLVALSIVGDLFESLLKRQAGVKDSSHLLPGHGGVLDRIDALLPVLPAAVLITRWLQ